MAKAATENLKRQKQVLQGKSHLTQRCDDADDTKDDLWIIEDLPSGVQD